MRLLSRLAAAGLLIATAACRGEAPAPAAAPPARERVYVSNETAGTIAIVDPVSGAVEAAIPVGKRPRGLRVSRDGRQLFVALSGSPIAPPGVDESTLPPADRSKDGIGVLDLATRKLVRTIDSGQDPEAFDLSPDGRWMYVSNEETAEMSVVDIAAGKVVRRVPVGEEPEGVTVSPDGRVVYVTCEGDNTVVAVDTASFAPLARIKVGPRPRSIAVTPDGRTLFVTEENAAAISVVDGATHTVTASIALPRDPNAPMAARPMGAVLSPDATRVYVSNGRGRSVAEIDATTRQLLRTFQNVGERPWGIGMSADGRRLFTANGPAGTVSIVDVASGAVTRAVTLGGSPWGIAVGSAP
jgi:YVTN family beta-propeller protein